MFKLASWNVNSLKVRFRQVLDWLNKSNVDVLALQETKLVDEQFPVQEFKSQGYHTAFAGQKTYNGVAIISRYPISEIITDIPNFEDPQRRMLAATIGELRLINLYVPNGSEVGSDKYNYKLEWLSSVRSFIKKQLTQYTKLAVVGDFNIAPADLDVHDPAAWEGCVHVSSKEREEFFSLLELGLYDSFREYHPQEQAFSWWDYRQASFRRNRGLRIDHILLNDKLKDSCKDSQIDKELRGLERPSDHAPVWVCVDSKIV